MKERTCGLPTERSMVSHWGHNCIFDASGTVERTRRLVEMKYAIYLNAKFDALQS